MTRDSARPTTIRRAAAGAVLAMCLTAVVAHAAPPAPPEPDTSFLDRLAVTRNFRAGQPEAITFAPGGGEVLFLRSGPRDRAQALWSHDVASGQEREVLSGARLLSAGDESLSREERARRERLRQTASGLVSFQLSRDGRRLLVPYSGRLFVVSRPGYDAREVGAAGLPAADDPRLSPDGTQVSLVRAGELRVLDLASGAERVIARPESASVQWGLPEFVAQEEMDRFEGHWWSPDSRWLLAQRTDHAGMEQLRIMDPFEPTAEPEANPYPRPGMRNADVRLAVFPAAGGAPVWVQWDREAWPYLCRVAWPDAGPLTIYVMNRAQQQASLLSVDPATGRTAPLLGERDAVWLNLPVGVPRWLASGKSFLWLSEHDDKGPTLELQFADATSRNLTPPGLRVREVYAVDEARRAAYVLAGEEPTEPQLWRVDLAKPWKAKRAGEGRGTERAVFARDAGLRVRIVSPERGATRWLLEDANGKPRGELRSAAEEPGVEPNVEWVKVGPDSLRGFIVRPRDFRAGQRYPVVDWAYAGPFVARVSRNGRAYLREQWLADRGFIVVSVDGRGTPWRGRAFERAIRGDLIGPALADHAAALRELAGRYPEMDGGRIGVMGGSFGGYFAAEAVMQAPDVYRAAVAIAPVADWRDYDTFYTERYLGIPPADSAAYARSSALLAAGSLVRPLLIIHGTSDDNVYFVHSLKLAAELNRTGRRYEFLPLPGRSHVLSATAQARLIHLRAAEFLERELGGVSDAAPPRP